HDWDLVGYTWEHCNDDLAKTASTFKNDPPSWYNVNDEESWRARLSPWRNSINDQLSSICSLASGCEHLEVFEFHAAREAEKSTGPKWRYIFDGVVSELITSLSHCTSNLNILTLDTWGSPVNGNNGECFCAALAAILPRVQHAKIRMQNVCPQIFRLPDAKAAQSTLQTMVLKMHEPADYDDGDEATFHVQCCPLAVGEHHVPELFHDMMIDAGRLLVKRLKCDEATPLKHLRISFSDPTYNYPNLIAVDCVSGTRWSDPEMFAYEDEGLPDWWELNDCLVEGEYWRTDGTMDEQR
ncbi:hypothetical protein LTS18_013904, partial [Coniosporium uncinatum]